jgi:CHAT domain-containing protein
MKKSPEAGMPTMYMDEMKFFRFDLPPGWILYPGSATLTKLAFIRWQDDAWITVEVFATLSDAKTEAEWLDAAAAAILVPETAEKQVLHRGESVALLAREVTAEKGETAALVVAGQYVDIVVKGSGPAISEHLDSALQRIFSSLAVRHWESEPPSERLEDAEALLQEVRSELARGVRDDLSAQLLKVLKMARESYASVVNHNGSVAARVHRALLAADALFLLAQTQQSAWLGHDAERLLRRILKTVEGDTSLAPLAENISDRLVAACNVQRVLMGSGGNPVGDLGSASMARVRISQALSEISSIKEQDPSAAYALLNATLDDALLIVVDIKATSPDNQAAVAQDTVIAASLAATVSQEAIRLEPTARRTLEADSLAVELARKAISVAQASLAMDVQKTLAMALLGQAGNLQEMGDPRSLTRADEAVTEADRLLDALEEEGALRAWSCVIKASILQWRQESTGIDAIISRGLAAAEHDESTASQHRTALERMQLELQAETANEAEQEAIIDSIQAELSDPLEGHDLLQPMARIRVAERWVQIGRWDRVLVNAVVGLEGVLTSAPFGTEALRALRIAAYALANTKLESSDLADLMFARQAAVAVQDVRRVLLDDSGLEVDLEEALQSVSAREEYLELLLSLGLYEDALRVADTGRAMVLSSLLGSPNSAARWNREFVLESVPGFVAQQWNREPSVLEHLRTALVWITSAAEQILAGLDAPLPIEVDDIRALAAETRCALVEVQPVKDQLVLFVVMPIGELSVRWAGASTTSTEEYSSILARELRINSVTRGDTQADENTNTRGDTQVDENTNEEKAATSQLSKSLLHPIADLLTDGMPLILSPYRSSWLIPFGLLQLPNGSLLAEKHALSLTPSFRTLRALRERGRWERPLPRKAFLVGNPYPLNERARAFLKEDLKGAEIEVAQIVELLRACGMPQPALISLTGSAATETAYRTNARDADLVHLSAHARIGRSALASTLYLAAGGSADGNLTAAELAKINIDDGLVILSACDSAQGRPTAEGLIGLARGFIEAGARAVVASLWKVSDPVSVVLMSHLYARLLDVHDPRNLMHSLQVASLQAREDLTLGRIKDHKGTVLDDRSAHWAPFVVIGDAASIQYRRDE